MSLDTENPQKCRRYGGKFWSAHAQLPKRHRRRLGSPAIDTAHYWQADEHLSKVAGALTQRSRWGNRINSFSVDPDAC